MALVYREVASMELAFQCGAESRQAGPWELRATFTLNHIEYNNDSEDTDNV